MSKKIKKIIGKGVLSILLLTTSFFYIGNICLITSFADENTEVSTTDKQQEAREKLVLYDYYSSSIYDKLDNSLVSDIGAWIYNTFACFSDFVFGDVDGVFTRLENCFDYGFSLDALTNEDFSEDLINKVVDIQDHYFVSKNGSRAVSKGENVSLDFYYPATVHSPIGGYEDVVKSVYSNYIWGFQKTDGGTYWCGGYGISQGEILNVCLNLYYSSSIYKIGLWHYKWGQSIGQFATINTYSDSLGMCSYNYQVPFDCNFVWNEQERFDKFIDNDKLKTLEDNSLNSDNFGLQFGDSVLNLLKKVDNNGNIDGVPVLNDDGSLNQQIINNYYSYGDSKFTELPQNYNVEIVDNDDNKDVDIVVPGDDGNFLTWIASILDNIVNFFKYCYEAMREIFISAKGIVEYVSLVFEILPPPLPSLMKLALIILLLVSVVGFIRG